MTRVALVHGRAYVNGREVRQVDGICVRCGWEDCEWARGISKQHRAHAAES